MRLLTVDTLEDAIDKLWKYIEKMPVNTEEIMTSLEGRVLAEDIVSPLNVPHFRRSTVDGYAVKAIDTQGASESIPTFLSVINEVEMGEISDCQINAGECVYVPTGGAVPEGADAMVMVEYCELFDGQDVAIYQSSAVGKDIVQIGEDVKKGELLLKKGTVLSPKSIGVLASIGKAVVKVYKPFSVTIISTGDEIREPGSDIVDGGVYDINTYALASEARAMGIVINNKYVLKDDEELLRKTIMDEIKISDIVVTSGGSSKGKKDVTAKVIGEIASSGILTHGIALRPGKPTITAFDEESQTILVGLPGHPVAALLVFKLLVEELYERKLEIVKDKFEVQATIATNIANSPGRMSAQLVELTREENTYIATPILGKSGLMTTLTKSHGYVIMDRNSEGLQQGQTVFVTLL